MGLWEVIIVSVGLSLDAFTIAVCKGSTQGNLKKSTAILVGIIFGVIQTIMLAAGMIIALYPMLNIYNERREEFFGYKGSVGLALATSIDAFILGIGFGLLRTEIISNILILFIVTSILVAIGLWVGYCMGNKYKKQIDICGGIILLAIGIKIICNYFNII